MAWEDRKTNYIKIRPSICFDPINYQSTNNNLEDGQYVLVVFYNKDTV